MSNKVIVKKQPILFNSIDEQRLSYANQLTVKSWNDIINILRVQTNTNTAYIKQLHNWLVGNTGEDITIPETDTSFVEYVLSGEQSLENLDVKNLYVNGKEVAIKENVVDLTSSQTITGPKTFSSQIFFNNDAVLSSSTGVFRFGDSSNVGALAVLAGAGTNYYLRPGISDKFDLGNPDEYWKDLYISGKLTDGTHNVSIKDIVTTTTNQTITGAKRFAGIVGNVQTESGVYLGIDENVGAPNANIAITSANTAAYIDMGPPNKDYGFRLIKWNNLNGKYNAELCYGDDGSGQGIANITIPRVSGTLALTSDIPPIDNSSGVQDIGWTHADMDTPRIATANRIAHWNGAYNNTNASNLKYGVGGELAFKSDIDNVMQVAEGKTKTYVIDVADNPKFNSDYNYISLTKNDTLITIDGVVIDLDILQKGDNILVINTTIPDRYFGGIHVSDQPQIIPDSYRFYMLETRKIDLDVKQDTLVSGENIKTIDGKSLLGNGDITTYNLIYGNAGPTDTVQDVITQIKKYLNIDNNEVHYEYVGHIRYTGYQEYLNGYINLRVTNGGTHIAIRYNDILKQKHCSVEGDYTGIANMSINNFLDAYLVHNRATKTSQLTNDSGFLTEHQDISGKADKTELENYLPLSGAKAMTGNLNMDNHDIKNVSTIGVDGTITTATKLLVHDENDDIITNSGWNYNASYYYASGIKFTTAQEQSKYNLYYPKETGTFVVRDDAGGIKNITRIIEPYNKSGIVFDLLNREISLYNPDSTIGLSSTEMINEGDIIHSLKFPDTSDGTGDGSWKTYTWNLPKQSGTIALLNDFTKDRLIETIGNATQLATGLLSAKDKKHLDTLVKLLEEDDDNVVNTINEILAIFNQYPEGANLVNALALKANKSEIVDLNSSQNIAGAKSFSRSITRGPKQEGQTGYVDIGSNSTPFDRGYITYLNAPISMVTFKPQNDNSIDLGSTDRRWRNIYLSGNLSDGTNSIKVEEIAKKSELPTDYINLNSNQEINGIKDFKDGIAIGGLKVLKDSSDRIAFYFSNNPKVKIGQLDTLFANRITPDSSNTYDIGRSGVYWKDLYLSGKLTDGTNEITIAQIVGTESTQTITGTKTFSNGIKLGDDNYSIKKRSNGSVIDIYVNDAVNPTVVLGRSSSSFGSTIRSNSTKAHSLGTADNQWKDLYLSGVLSDGTNSITIAQIVNMLSTLTREQLVSTIGEATASLSGLMSAEDKTNLNTLVALLQEDDNDVVDKINEVLAIFNQYPEGADLVSALALKANKNEVVDLTSDQTISGNKTFETIKIKYPDKDNFFQISPDGNGYNVKFKFANNILMMLHNAGITNYRDILPDTNNTRNLGSSSASFKNAYIRGYLSDGTNNVSVSDIANKSDITNLISRIEALESAPRSSGTVYNDYY